MTRDPGGVSPLTRVRARLQSSSIRLRIVLAFLAAVSGMLALIGWLALQQQPVAESLHLVTEGYLPLSRQVALLLQDQDRVQRDLNRLTKGRPRPVAGETSAADIYTQELRDNVEIARVLTESMRAQTTRSEEQAVLSKALAYLNTVDELFRKYQEQSGAYQWQAGSEPSAEDLEALRRPLRTTGKLLGEELEKLQSTLDGRIRLLTRDSEERQQRATALALLLAGAATLGLSVLLGAVFLAVRPIGRLTEEAGRIAAGEYGRRVDVTGADEIGRLAAEFNAMAEAIEARDLSLQDRAQQLDRVSSYLSSVLDSLEDGLVVVDAGRVTLANPAAVREWGVVVDAEPPEALREALEPGTHTLAMDAVTWSVRCVPFGQGGRVAILSDVTAQLLDQQRLARSERLALIGQMLAQITHEVRNPLNALSLNVELLVDEVEALDPEHRTEVHEVLALMGREVERLTVLTGHYLQLARRPPAHPEPTDVAGLIRETIRLVEPELRAEGIALAVQAEGLGRVPVDAGQLRQALLNVLRNAAQAGARHVAVTARLDDGLVIDVKDDGSGMADDDRLQAGEPFFTTKASGTGLGLAITRQIIEDHEGRVVIRSTPGEGTTVSFHLPERGEAVGGAGEGDVSGP